jgi:hypothetical protein
MIALKLSFIFEPQLNLNLILQQELHFDVQPLMAHLNMKFPQCFGSAANIIAYEFNFPSGLAFNNCLKICDSQSLINCPEDKIIFNRFMFFMSMQFMKEVIYYC